MGNTMLLPRDALNQIIDYVKEQGSYVLASPEDANFFRAIRLPKIETPPVEQKISAPIPATPPPIAKPVPTPISAPPPKPIPKEEPTLPKPSFDLSSVRHVLSVVAPELTILNEIPSDEIARKIAERWKTKNQSAPISILVYQEPPEQRLLLEQIAKALAIYFGPAKIVEAEKIEKEKQWGAFLSVAELKMVIVCDYTLWQLNGLMQFYKETPAQGLRNLGNVPLFLLPDLSLYLKDALLKRSLWKALCQKFS
jgi:hypothetical protein